MKLLHVLVRDSLPLTVDNTAKLHYLYVEICFQKTEKCLFAMSETNIVDYVTLIVPGNLASIQINAQIHLSGQGERRGHREGSVPPNL